MTDSGVPTGGLEMGGGEPGSSGGGGGPGWRGWAVYLGMSWTWCIGMFLPALLWRDFGIRSFVVFAIPNVVGAALLGVVMRTPEASRAFIERHRVACVAFSVVTVAFQVFFAAWVARWMGAASGASVGARVGAGGLAWHAGWIACVLGLLVGGGRKWGAVVGGVVWLVSLATIVVTVARSAQAGALDELTSWPGSRALDELAPLALVCLLGFGLCPYLDLTFHRARIESGNSSGRAFGAGFGLVFASMIVGTVLTAPVLLFLVGAGVEGVDLRPLLAPLLVLHTLPQLVYTCWVQAGELRKRERPVAVVCALGAGLGVALLDGGVLMSRYGGLYAPEVLYRLFMG
ncbi:MAG: hypothetical protein K2Q09_11160, partial [Phycisphaerales bacterium]|nr:hypothetical protein [Phycisphaerales bacterium]